MIAGVALWALVSAASTNNEVHRVALVVGSNHSDINAAPLRYADDDAVAMHELLTEAGVESTLLTTMDSDTANLHPQVRARPPTERELLAAFEAQRTRVAELHAKGARVEWLFFFSGHGDADHGSGFLGLEEGRLTRQMLHETMLARSGADVAHVIIDACKSALLVAGKGPGGRREPFAASFAHDASDATKVGFIVSASTTRESHEWERVQAGVFSYEVRSALRGAADADGDHALSYAEVGAFLQHANSKIANPAYRPDFLVLPPDAKAGLDRALLEWVTPTLRADIALGHVYIERSNGERVLDVHAAPHFVAELHLPPERPLFVRTADEQHELVLKEQTVSWSESPVTDAQTHARGALGLAFAQLFEAPYDGSAVERFRRSYEPPSVQVADGVEVQRPTWLQPLAGWTAVATAALSVASFSVAWGLHDHTLGYSQAALVSRNAQLTALNVTGVVTAGVAALAGATWLWCTVSGAQTAPLSLAAGPGGVWVGGAW